MSKFSVPSRILITGAYGLLGTRLSAWLSGQGYSVLRQGRGQQAEFSVDPVNQQSLDTLLRETNPDAVVNLIAMTNVDGCEQNPQAAYQANVRSVESLVQALRSSSAQLIHLSTDQVYDGIGPHDESQVDPCNVYALTKYAGELVAERCNATILRTNFVGRSHTPGRLSLTDWLVQAFRERRSITLFDDVSFSPLHINSLCAIIEQAIQHRLSGLYNIGCRDALSKAAFGLALADQLGLDASYAGVGRAADLKLLARRPLDMSLSVERFECAFQCAAPTMAETLKQVKLDYLEGKTDASRETPF